MPRWRLRSASTSGDLIDRARSVAVRPWTRPTRRAGRGRRRDAAAMPSNSSALAAVRQVRRRLADTGPERVRATGDFARVSIPRNDGDALRDLLIAEGARSVIEIGLAYGSSALAIGEALLVQQGSSEHLIIDAYQHLFHESGTESIVSAGLADRCRSFVIDRSSRCRSW